MKKRRRDLTRIKLIAVIGLLVILVTAGTLVANDYSKNQKVAKNIYSQLELYQLTGLSSLTGFDLAVDTVVAPLLSIKSDDVHVKVDGNGKLVSVTYKWVEYKK